MRSVCLAGLWSIILIAGCGRNTPAEHAAAVRSHGEAVAKARAAADVKSARKEFAASEKSIEALRKLAAADAALQKSLAEVEPVHANARVELEFAEEEQTVRDTLNSYKAKAYRAARAVTLRGVCESLALACEEANRTPATAPATTSPSLTSRLHDSVLQSAALAVALDGCTTNRPLRADGTPDYPAIAAAMRAMGKSPPPELGLLLGLGFLITGRDDLALIEISAVDPTTLRSPEHRLGRGMLHGAILRIMNCDRLALAQIEAVAPGQSAEGAAFGPEAQAAVHLMLAAMCAMDKDYDRMDLEMVRASRVWPNNPVTVFLTGERLLAEGKPEAAAGSLEHYVASKGHDATWARLIAERARQLRDEKGAARPLLMDPKLRLAIISHYAASYAERESGQALARMLKAGNDFAQRVMPGSTAPAN